MPTSKIPTRIATCRSFLIKLNLRFKDTRRLLLLVLFFFHGMRLEGGMNITQTVKYVAVSIWASGLREGEARRFYIANGVVYVCTLPTDT